MSFQIIAIDYGEKRVGIAIANSIARIANPFATLQNDDTLLERLQTIVTDEQVDVIVVGLPRNLEGDDTAQTKVARDFAEKLSDFGTKIVFQDEAATSAQAHEEIGASKRIKHNQSVDSLAATYILEDYMRESLHG